MTTAMAGEEHLWAVIPAGGAGTRLWPLSRQGEPKFLLDLTGSGRSLLQDTVARLSPVVGERLLVVTGARHRDAVLQQLPELDPDRVIGEPSPRDSMAAIGLAAAMVERLDPDAVIGSFAADHIIDDPASFADAVRVAAGAANAGRIVTIGIEPTQPSTGFGYIAPGEPLPGHPGVFAVDRFVEKPSADLAEEYLAQGYRWNAGMFVFRPGILLDLLARWRPELADGLRSIAAAPDRLDELWPGLEKIAIDHAIAEPAADLGQVAMVPATFGWDDIGDFESLRALLGDPSQSLTVLGDDHSVCGIDASGLVVPQGGRMIAVVGVSDVVVIDTRDALLVTTRSRVQDVKGVVTALQQAGRTELI